MKRSHTDRQLASSVHGRSAGFRRVDSVIPNAQGLLEFDYHVATLSLPRPVIARTYFLLRLQILDNEN